MIEKRIAIVLPTYNGERYLPDQLDSILQQDTDLPVDVFVRDDGSVDSTTSIIDDYVEKTRQSKKRILRVVDDLGNLGVPRGFYHLLKLVNGYSFYAFCDQDDIWEPNKLSRAVSFLDDSAASDPLVYCGSFDYLDADRSFVRDCAPLPSKMTFDRSLFYTIRQGFSIVINDAARREFILPFSETMEMHDRYIIRCAASMGVLLLDDAVTAHHVRHAAAVTSGDSCLLSSIRVFLFDELLGDEAHKDYCCLVEFLERFGSRLSVQDVRTLQFFTSDAVPFKRIRRAFVPRRMRSTFGGELALRISFLFNRYE